MRPGIGQNVSCAVGDFILWPGKLDLLFHTSNFLDLHAGGRSLFINHYQQVLCTLGKSTTAIKSGRVIVWKAIMTKEEADAKQ